MSPYIGVVFKIISALLFTGMSALIKWLGDAVPTGQVVFARSLFALVPIGAYVVWRAMADRRAVAGGAQGPASMGSAVLAAIHTNRPFGHLLRGVMGCAAMACGFTAVTLMPLPDAITIGYAAPLVTVLLAPLLLKERVGIYRLSAVAAGFLGVVMALSPHLAGGVEARGDTAALGAMFALAGALGVALTMIQIRNLTRTESTTAITVYFSLTGTLLGLATLPFGWVMPDPVQALMLVAIGVIGGVAQIFLTESYRRAPTSLIAPFDYTTLLWALALGFLVFCEVPEPIVLAGAAIIVVAGLFVIYRERQLGLERGRARRAGGVPLN